MFKKLNHLRTLLLLFVLGWGVSQASAQQIPIPTQYLFFPGLYNQAGMGTESGGRIFLSHQQRKVAFTGGANSQIVSFSAKPLTDKRLIGLGITFTNDREFTERRTAISGVLSYHIINNGTSNALGMERTRLSAGASLGMIGWGNDYSDVPVVDRSDGLLVRQTAFSPDAGLGVDFLMGKPAFQLRGGFSLQQIPAAFYRGQNYTFTPIPHYLASASAMFRLGDGIWGGPMLTAKDGIASENGSIGGGQIDINAKVAFPGKNIWAAAGYRTGAAGLNLAYGMRLLDRERSRLGLSFIAEYPLNNSRIFGPSIDLGLAYGFGAQ